MIGDDAFEDVHEAEDRNLAKGSSWNLGRNITLKTSAEVKETISLDQTDASRADPLSPLASRLENKADAPIFKYPGKETLPEEPTKQNCDGDLLDEQRAEPGTESTGQDIEDWMGLGENDAATNALNESLRERITSIPGLEFYKDKDYCRVVDFLMTAVAKLKVENSALKKELDGTVVSAIQNESAEIGRQETPSTTAQAESPVFERFHVVYCNDSGTSEKNCFRDVPRKFKGDVQSDHIRGQIQLPNTSKNLDDNKRTAFLIVSEYDCDTSKSKDFQRSVGYKNGRLIADSPLAESKRGHIAVGPVLHRALKAIVSSHQNRFKGCKKRLPSWYPEPYFLFYIHNRTFVELSECSGLDDFDRICVQLLHSYLEKECRKDWNEADELLSRGKINGKHLSKLYRPSELIINRSKDGEDTIQAEKVIKYPFYDPKEQMSSNSWTFNGKFRKLKRTTEVKANCMEMVENPDDEKDIKENCIWVPLRFCDDGLQDRLVSRGTKFWNCRKKKLLSYVEPTDYWDHQAERRFMVDYGVLRRMHPGNPIFSITQDNLGDEVMDRDATPDDDFLACLPPKIHAYDLLEKAWKHIRIDRTTDVTWNKSVFKHLVLPPQTKELIQAAVTARGQRVGGAADSISGKGQGLLILLHGGPGTGKTLTAESIAEEQERPLYRVTCGDIGIEPREVETYLGYVLEIAKAWGCVVLLDEADVFLEERSGIDHKRNAIISIFLRVLEYFDGVLILTTNRVGRFDEAFKSRIQLALGYPNLDEEQREQIWCNFFRLLDPKKERIDIEDLKVNTHKLAKFDINERQIRNVITMARHLARFRNQRLVYSHMQDAVAAVVKFNEYLQDVKGAPDDEIAEYERARAIVT